MKRKKFENKLTLNKTTISNLNITEMNNLRGGLTDGYCNTQDECTRPKYCETRNMRNCDTGAVTCGCESLGQCSGYC